jgi:hypothetical protein
MRSAGCLLRVRTWAVRVLAAVAGGVAVAGMLGAASAPPAELAAARPPDGRNSGASISGQLTGVSALSASDAWAVGISAGSNPSATLILHWNGTAWVRVRGPAIPFNVLDGVSMVSARDGWAVGNWDDTTTNNQPTLILHWNGTRWSKVPSPSPGNDGNHLLGVSAISATDAWAVGYYFTSPGGLEYSLILHWNGTRWTKVPSPNPDPGDSGLAGVSAASASDAWAVGTTGKNFSVVTMTVHWNGTSWTDVASPSPGGTLGSQLSAVSDSSRTNAWAVGLYSTPTSSKSLTLHWNGTSWRHVKSPSPSKIPPQEGAPPQNELAGVSHVSHSGPWTVGDYSTSTAQVTMILHWNGTRWIKVPSPGRTGLNFLAGISMDSSSDGWAVGGNPNTGKVLLLHWNGTSWARS